MSNATPKFAVVRTRPIAEAIANPAGPLGIVLSLHRTRSHALDTIENDPALSADPLVIVARLVDGETPTVGGVL